MKRFTLFGICLFSLLLSLAGCEEKKVGCMDIDAANVDVTAEEDCCCNFTGKLVFWYDQAASDSMQMAGITDLSYYVDGQFKAVIATNVFYTQPPNCGEAGVFTIVQDMGAEKTKNYTYEVKDQNGNLMWNGMKSYNGGKCNNVQLVY